MLLQTVFFQPFPYPDNSHKLRWKQFSNLSHSMASAMACRYKYHFAPQDFLYDVLLFKFWVFPGLLDYFKIKLLSFKKEFSYSNLFKYFRESETINIKVFRIQIMLYMDDASIRLVSKFCGCNSIKGFSVAWILFCEVPNANNV